MAATIEQIAAFLKAEGLDFSKLGDDLLSKFLLSAWHWLPPLVCSTPQVLSLEAVLFKGGRSAFDTLLEAKVLIEWSRRHYNMIPPNNALGYRPPAPETLQLCAIPTAAFPQPHRAGLVGGTSLT